MTIEATAFPGLSDECRGRDVPQCPGPPRALPDPHGSRVPSSDRDGWDHLDECGGCRVVIRRCATREPAPCQAAERSFQDEAARVTRRAQLLWAKKQRAAGHAITPWVLNDTMADLYVKALRRLHGFSEEKVRSEQARFSTYWLRFLALDAGELYVRGLKEVKSDAALPEDATSVEMPEPRGGAFDEDGVEQALAQLAAAREWYLSRDLPDRELLAGLVSHLAIREVVPNNSELSRGLYGPDTQARARSQKIRRLEDRLRAEVVDPLLSSVEPLARTVIADLVIRAARTVSADGYADPDQLVAAVDAAAEELRATVRSSRQKRLEERDQ